MSVLPASKHEDSDFSPPGQRPPPNSRTEGPYSPPSVASRCRGAGPRHLRSRCWGMMAQVGKKGGDLRHWSAQETVLRRRSPTKKPTCAKSRAYLRHQPSTFVPMGIPAPGMGSTCAKVCAPSFYPSVFPSWGWDLSAGRGFPTIRATLSGSRPKQRASWAMEVRKER